MSILYTYSTKKNQYFYISEKVKDKRYNIEGIIIKIYYPFNLKMNESFIKVKYSNKKIIYQPNDHIYLESIN